TTPLASATPGSGPPTPRPGPPVAPVAAAGETRYRALGEQASRTRTARMTTPRDATSPQDSQLAAWRLSVPYVMAPCNLDPPAGPTLLSPVVSWWRAQCLINVVEQGKNVVKPCHFDGPDHRTSVIDHNA